MNIHKEHTIEIIQLEADRKKYKAQCEFERVLAIVHLGLQQHARFNYNIKKKWRRK
jgi:hypothetical protein